jgi:DNA-binding response OmpR family regulator
MSSPNQPVILVADDEPLILKLITAMLSREGFRVLKAENGQEAMIRVKEKPDLILLDILMPEMGGLETCRRLKNDPLTRDIPVIFLSALLDSKTKDLGFQLGGQDFIDKPFRKKELLARVKTHLIFSRGIIDENNDRLTGSAETELAEPPVLNKPIRLNHNL